MVSCKRFRDEGLYTFLGMVGYFEFVHNNVSVEDMNDGKMEYAKFKKVRRIGNNYVSLSHSNVLQRAHQWAIFRMKKHLGVTFPRTLFHMCKSNQLCPNSTWVIPSRSACMDVKREAST